MYNRCDNGFDLLTVLPRFEFAVFSTRTWRPIPASKIVPPKQEALNDQMEIAESNMKFNTALKMLGLILVVVGLVISHIGTMLLGILCVLLVIANCVTAEAYELSNQIGDTRDRLRSELHEAKSQIGLLREELETLVEDAQRNS